MSFTGLIFDYRNQLTITTMNRIEFIKNTDLDFNTVELYVDGQQAGFINYEGRNGDVARMGEIFINPQFRGKGFYRQLIRNMCSLYGLEGVYSHTRNEESNAIYKFWTGYDDLSPDDQVDIWVNGETLDFEVV